MTQMLECPPAPSVEPVSDLASLLAAVHYSNQDGLAADEMLTRLAHALKQRGMRLAGAVQRNAGGGARRCADMRLEDLGSNRLIAISQFRGHHARSCHLDTSALEEAVGLAAATIENGADLLVINKFGKRECSGGGFRSVIDDALAAGIPVIAGVNEASSDGWADYTGGLARSVSLDFESVLSWCLYACPTPDASTIAGGNNA